MTHSREPVVRCRVCRKPARLRPDETVVNHAGPDRRPCPGGMLPPEGDTPCPSTCNPVGTVSWPPLADIRAGSAHRSTYVCDSPSHQAEASAWVEAGTGHPGVFAPFTRR